MGELAAEEDGVVVRSKTPDLAPMGELRESLREWTGEEVREGMERGGGEENFRHSLGDLLLRGSPPHAPWLVAKNSSRDLRGGTTVGAKQRKREGTCSSLVLILYVLGITLPFILPVTKSVQCVYKGLCRL